MPAVSMTEMIMTWEEDADERLVVEAKVLVIEGEAVWRWDSECQGVAGLILAGTNRALVVLYTDGDFEVSKEMEMRIQR